VDFLSQPTENIVVSGVTSVYHAHKTKTDIENTVNVESKARGEDCKRQVIIF